MDPSIFVPERGQNVSLAKKVCETCPELWPCQAYALSAPLQLGGVWGGTTALDRRRRRRNLAFGAPMTAELSDIEEPSASELLMLEQVENVTESLTVSGSTNGNGHGLIDTKSLSVDKSPGTGKTCERCGTALSGEQVRWCSNACRKAGGKKALVAARSSHNGPVRTAPQAAPQNGIADVLAASAILLATGVTDLSFSIDGWRVTAART